MRYHLAIQDRKYAVEIGAMIDGGVEVNVNDEVYHVTIQDSEHLGPGLGSPKPVNVTGAVPVGPSTPVPSAAQRMPFTPPRAAAVGNGAVTAPIPGLILDFKVMVGDVVAIGQIVAIMEAMKMENNIRSPIDGKVLEIRVAKGTAVADGEIIMVIG